ncbi:methylenetetrahydrofolate reductase-like [Lingula anatina]|uniref:methylenetetrahydrofolate reductase (NADPH) n=1 Tax=Lingula anatina TaxID=7574 RepID=A0A1S3HII0_LINAN|nr:methylenetetrahydrofolate reductase-like [Lingula anatina]|eukprot:XP_013384814.1 methylenetetrahydrofolate reductase-like [Lingula anatina]
MKDLQHSPDRSPQNGTPATPSPNSSRPESPGLLPYKYISLMDRIKAKIADDEPFFSLEFFPPKTEEGAVNLVARLERMLLGGPLFCDITWHSAGDPTSDKHTSSTAIAGTMLNYVGMETMLHLTCIGASKATMINQLERAKELGIRNILALRGDAKFGEEWKPEPDGFNYATDLVRFIRLHYGDYFVICVAGYPSGHPDCESYEADLQNLKTKVDAGADFIITQLIFQSKTFLKYVQDCRNIGITVPILPGIMPFQSYQSLRHITRLSKMEIPQEILDEVIPIKDNDEAIRNWGIDIAYRMCSEILAAKGAPGLHFYTLNREVATVSVLKRLGMWCEEPKRMLPWKPTANHIRCMEDVRPIFWRARQKSYVQRTSDWEDFPNGRWGDSSSAAFGALKDHYPFYLTSKSSHEELLSMWKKELNSEEDVWDVFYHYITGEAYDDGVKVTRLPWEDDEVTLETSLISSELASINRKGVLTINSQPRINCVPSTDPAVGWGSHDGYIFQKAYLEFFVSKEKVDCLKEILPEYPLVNYHIVNCTGEADYTNCDEHKPIAVTWGVFPGREIIQPTVVDPVAFKAWKDEAFMLWLNPWADLYPEGSRSQELIRYFHDNYYLVNLVDNEFPKETVLWEIVDRMCSMAESRSDGAVQQEEACQPKFQKLAASQ